MEKGVTFGAYAAFYDTFYATKDYEGECRHIVGMWRRHGRWPVRSVLDLGCGTGGHALVFARLGYRVMGLDRSAAMLRRAAIKARDAGLPIGFRRRDIRAFSLGRAFDAVVALFAVFGYLVDDRDQVATLRCVRHHLDAGRLFLFDAWYGPAVLSQRPTVRTLTVDKEGRRIRRSAMPTLDLDNKTVSVAYAVTEEGKTVLQETHTVRFFFPEEIERLAGQTGFEVTAMYPFMAPDATLDATHWSFTCVLRAN